jgi:hypothetical protein
MIGGLHPRWLTVIGMLSCLAGTATGQMVRSETIGNDPAKEHLCASRAKATQGTSKTVPFEIDSGYVARSRALNPDATFIAIGGQLIECFLLEGSGQYGPAVISPEQSFWHLIKPQQSQPPIGTLQGDSFAVNVCRKAALSKITKRSFDHTAISLVTEVNAGRPVYHPGILIGGKKAENYDVVVKGNAFYGPANPDLTAIAFACLLSPMLELKAVQLK